MGSARTLIQGTLAMSEDIGTQIPSIWGVITVVGLPACGGGGQDGCPIPTVPRILQQSPAQASVGLRLRNLDLAEAAVCLQYPSLVSYVSII